MTKKKKLQELSLEELYLEKKKRKEMLTVLGITMLIICFALVGLAIKSGNYALIAVACGSFITLLPSFTYLSQLETEIKTREQK